MVKCKRCGKNFCDSFLERDFCFNCSQEFSSLVEKLKAGFIADWNEDDVKGVDKVNDKI